MTLDRIRALLGHYSLPEVAEATGLSVRLLYGIKAGRSNITMATMGKLEAWAKGRKLPREVV